MGGCMCERRGDFTFLFLSSYFYAGKWLGDGVDSVSSLLFFVDCCNVVVGDDCVWSGRFYTFNRDQWMSSRIFIIIVDGLSQSLRLLGNNNKAVVHVSRQFHSLYATFFSASFNRNMTLLFCKKKLATHGSIITSSNYTVATGAWDCHQIVSRTITISFFSNMQLEPDYKQTL